MTERYCWNCGKFTGCDYWFCSTECETQFAIDHPEEYKDLDK